MRSVLVLALAGILSVGFAVANMLLGDGRLLPGWVIVGVVFLLSGAAAYAFGGEDDGTADEEYTV